MKEFSDVNHSDKGQGQDQQSHRDVAEKDTGNSMIVFVNIFLVEFGSCHLLGRNAETEIQQQCVAEEIPQHDPQTVLCVTEITDEPAGDEDTLYQADKH